MEGIQYNIFYSLSLFSIRRTPYRQKDFWRGNKLGSAYIERTRLDIYRHLRPNFPFSLLLFFHLEISPTKEIKKQAA